ncbi:MAG: protein phosphatase 2C domain-containing protein, partial [Candidatus Binataceae bacterium]
MITCPECGAGNEDGAKFCDRCGQGLSAAPAGHAAPAALPPLPAGAELKGGLRIAELLSQSSEENRYRAERLHPAAKGDYVVLRERRADDPPPDEASGESQPPAESSPIAEEDPAGPRAKTADLKLKPPPANLPASAEGVLIESQQEPRHEAATPASDAAIHSAINNGTALGTIADATVDDPAGAGQQAGPPSEPAAETTADASAGQVETVAAEAGPSSAISTSDPPPETAIGVNGAEAANPAPQDEAEPEEEPSGEDLGEVFGRVMALSLTLTHPAFERALSGFAQNGRVYLAYQDSPVTPLARRAGGLRMDEPEALSIAIQLCQAAAFAHRRGLRVNDICPASVGYGSDGRIHLTGLDAISNDDELQAEPLFNDGYTAPEIYKGRKVDKRADIFSIGALLYTCLTGERLESESWRGEAGAIRFYPPHVVAPALEQAVRKALVFDPAGRWLNVDAFKAELVRISNAFTIRASMLTDVGMVRELNEDAVIAAEYRRDSQVEPAQNLLYVIADGMGGAEAGEIASAIAVAAIRNYVEQSVAASPRIDARQVLQQALEDANSRILAYQADHAEARGMGSTAVSTLIVPPDAAVAWVGDSRAYFYDQGGLRQLTKDHSLVQRLIEIGQLTPEEARHHEHKNVITRSLGARQSGPAGAESLALRFKRGDKLLMCSDGLTAHVD